MSRTLSRIFDAGLHPSRVSQYLHVHFCAGTVWMSSHGLYVLEINLKNIFAIRRSLTCSLLCITMTGVVCLYSFYWFALNWILTYKSILTNSHSLNCLKIYFVLKSFLKGHLTGATQINFHIFIAKIRFCSLHVEISTRIYSFFCSPSTQSWINALSTLDFHFPTTVIRKRRRITD